MATLNPAQLQVHQLGLTCKDGRGRGEFGKLSVYRNPSKAQISSSPLGLSPIQITVHSGPKPFSEYSSKALAPFYITVWPIGPVQ